MRNGACRLPLLSLSPLTLNDGDKRETFSFSLSSLPSPLSSSPLPLPWWQPASPAASRRRVVSSLHSSRGLLLPPPVLPRRWRRRRCSARRRRPPLRPPPARLRSSADCPLAAASRAGCGLVFSPYLCIPSLSHSRRFPRCAKREEGNDRDETARLKKLPNLASEEKNLYLFPSSLSTSRRAHESPLFNHPNTLQAASLVAAAAPSSLPEGYAR